MSEDKQGPSGWKDFFKVLGAIAVVLLFLAVVGFGLLVGFCGILRR